jgi:hypothetical protein
MCRRDQDVRQNNRHMASRQAFCGARWNRTTDLSIIGQESLYFLDN